MQIGAARTAGGLRATFLGHSTVLLDFEGGPRLLTDPVLRGRLGPLRHHGPRQDGAPVADAVLISHAHHDHLDLPSLRLLAADGPLLIVPAGLGSLLRRRGFRHVEEVLPGDASRVGEARIEVTPAEHDGTRRPLGPRAPAVGYVVRAGAAAYFAGDTGLFPGLAELAGRVDLALLPVWGWGPRLGPGHLDPESAAAAAALVAAPVAVPIHWGTLFPFGLERLWPGPLRDPGHEFARQVAARRLPVEVRVLRPGESTWIEASGRGSRSRGAA